MKKKIDQILWKERDNQLKKKQTSRRKRAGSLPVHKNPFNVLNVNAVNAVNRQGKGRWGRRGRRRREGKNGVGNKCWHHLSDVTVIIPVTQVQQWKHTHTKTYIDMSICVFICSPSRNLYGLPCSRCYSRGSA